MSKLLGNPIQMGNVVPDINLAMEECLELGIGPFYVGREMAIPSRYLGAQHDLVFSCAFAYTGDIQIEFIQQNNTVPSAFRDFLERKPGGGLHHLAFYADDFQVALDTLNAKGRHFRVVQEFIFEDGGAHEVYIERVTPSAQSLAVQLVNSGNPASVDFFTRMKAVTDEWDGRDPIRPMSDITG